MAAVIFDGRKEAAKREAAVFEQVKKLRRRPRLLSVVFQEDEGSQLYTRLKFQAASRVGIDFDRQDFSFGTDVEMVQEAIRQAGEREDITGVMIQKPSKNKWLAFQQSRDSLDFELWWLKLTSCLLSQKDVDCLGQTNLALVLAGRWRLLPATVKAILGVLEVGLGGKTPRRTLTKVEGVMQKPLNGKKALVIGQSDIVGKPLAAVLRQAGAETVTATSQTVDLAQLVGEAELLISAVGKQDLVKSAWVKKGAIVIDVGAPRGDIEPSVRDVASFFCPVPYGVGPVTVVSLLENLTDLAYGLIR